MRPPLVAQAALAVRLVRLPARQVALVRVGPEGQEAPHDRHRPHASPQGPSPFPFLSWSCLLTRESHHRTCPAAPRTASRMAPRASSRASRRRLSKQPPCSPRAATCSLFGGTHTHTLSTPTGAPRHPSVASFMRPHATGQRLFSASLLLPRHCRRCELACEASELLVGLQELC